MDLKFIIGSFVYFVLGMLGGIFFVDSVFDAIFYPLIVLFAFIITDNLFKKNG